jgi:hypothetical protein
VERREQIARFVAALVGVVTLPRWERSERLEWMKERDSETTQALMRSPISRPNLATKEMPL